MPLKLGDRNEAVRQWRVAMNRWFGPAYSRLHGPLPTDTNEFGPRAQAWQKEYQVRTKQAPSFAVASGVVSDNDLLLLGVTPPPAKKLKPVLFTVEGHLSNMFVGPCAETARALEREGVCEWQPVGYDNVSIPFNNQSGINELVRLMSAHTLPPRPDGRVVPFPPGTPWGLAIYSQGAIVGAEFFMRHIRPANGSLHWRAQDFKGCLSFGSPYRERGVVAEWVPDPPRPDTQGISDVRMTNTPHNWKEVARRGDIYTENEVNDAGEHKTAIYKAVQGEFWGPLSIPAQLMAIGLNPTPELIAVAIAIRSGVMFLADMSPHGNYDLGPCIDFMRRQLT